MRPVSRYTASMSRAVLIIVLIAAPAAHAHEPPGGPDFALYDPDPDHLWNRLHRTLFMRETHDGRFYGHDDFELVYWDQTKHLLNGHSYNVAITVLDEFLASEPKAAFENPLEFALLQRDLWALFDWAASERAVRLQWDDEGFAERRMALLDRLARAIELVALDRAAINALPDNYAAAVHAQNYPEADSPNQHQPYLPPDLLAKETSWVRIIGSGEHGPRSHVFDTRRRTLFWTYLRLPGGREPTLKFMAGLRMFRMPYVPMDELFLDPDTHPEFTVELSPLLPPLPPGSEVALMQQAMLIDSSGEIVPANLIEKVQFRVYRDWDAPYVEGMIARLLETEQPIEQVPYEFRLSRSKYLAQEDGGLSPLSLDAVRFATFRTHGVDPFEWEPPKNQQGGGFVRGNPEALARCVHCHGTTRNINSFQSVRQIIGTWDGTRAVNPLNWNTTPSRAQETAEAIAWKKQHDSWTLLREFINSQEH
jgi:hypothetical protein